MVSRALLSLDLGTVTGWAIITVTCAGFAVASGTWDFRPGRFDGAGVRYVRFRKQLLEILLKGEVGAVFFEEVRRHVGADAARVYGALFGVVTSVCEELKIPYNGVPVGTIKKSWTGKGNASKDMMVAEAIKHGYDISDDNEADAIALAHYAHAMDDECPSPALAPDAPKRSRVLS